MIEACVICSSPCKIPDLGLDLLRGQEVWLSDEVARASEDLRREQAKGNVRVMRKSRRMDKREAGRPAPPFVALTRPQHRAPVSSETAPELSAPVVDTDAIAREVQDKIVEGLRSTIAQELSRALASQPAPAPVAPAPAPPPAPTQAQLDPTQLAGVLESVLRRVMPAGAAQAVRADVASEDPLYMPGKLVDKDAKAKIEVKQTSSDEAGGDLDDAAEALRRMKRGRGRTDEENDR